MVPEDEQNPSQKQDESQISEAQVMNNLFYMEPSRRPTLFKTKSGDVHHKTMSYQCIGQSGSNSQVTVDLVDFISSAQNHRSLIYLSINPIALAENSAKEIEEVCVNSKTRDFDQLYN